MGGQQPAQRGVGVGVGVGRGAQDVAVLGQCLVASQPGTVEETGGAREAAEPGPSVVGGGERAESAARRTGASARASARSGCPCVVVAACGPVLWGGSASRH